MANGGDRGNDDDAGVVAPEELDISAQEDVASLGEGRYVIGSDGSPDPPADATEPDTSEDADADVAATPASDDASANGDAEQSPETGGSAEREVTGRDVKRWLSDELEGHDSDYAYHIAAKADEDVAHQRLATNDIGAAFDGLLVWYARQVASGTAVDEALGILLSESSVQPRYPTKRLVDYVEAHGLGPDDTIRDLVEVVAEEDGLAFPRRE